MSEDSHSYRGVVCLCAWTSAACICYLVIFRLHWFGRLLGFTSQFGPIPLFSARIALPSQTKDTLKQFETKHYKMVPPGVLKNNFFGRGVPFRPLVDHRNCGIEGGISLRQLR